MVLFLSGAFPPPASGAAVMVEADGDWLGDYCPFNSEYFMEKGFITLRRSEEQGGKVYDCSK